ncbi:Proteasome component region PCI and 26S proteasome regulatory subunit domain containing protein [Aphelenchoides fujianensis]|nr:Proteasome component region PCI and 26S proteasome regulatory subunit domain containing protein [Aphelenchoides fujianensis]
MTQGGRAKCCSPTVIIFSASVRGFQFISFVHPTFRLFLSFPIEMGVQPMEVDPPASKEKTEKEKPEKKKDESDINSITFENLREWCNQLERGDTHIVGRVLQFLNRTRKQLNPEILTKLCNTYLYASPNQKKQLLSYLPAKTASSDTSMEVDTKSTPTATKSASSTSQKKQQLLSRKAVPSPELELYIHLLVLLFLTDEKKYDLALECAKFLIQCADRYDKRSLDPFLAKGYFYLSLISERTGKIGTLAPYLNSRLRFATLHHQNDSQATLIVCLLRAYLLTKNLLPAAKLVTKVAFPESANNNDLARYLYYMGRIRALQLQRLQDSAIGFKQNVHKWVVVISLLRGEIPERAIFRTSIYRATLGPYLQLDSRLVSFPSVRSNHRSCSAVRLGDIALFNKVLEKFSGTFETDETLTLIVRLRQNVIRTAIRQISLAYSRIPHQGHRPQAAGSCRRTPRRSTSWRRRSATTPVDAVITFDTKTADRYMHSGVSENIYRTTEPQFAYDTRIKNCLELHNLAVKALRFPGQQEARERKDGAAARAGASGVGAGERDAGGRRRVLSNLFRFLCSF